MSAGGASPGRPRRARAPGRGAAWRLLLLGCLALAALAHCLPAGPTYDPWAWIIWGREITEWDLDTRTGPSWKPLPVLFTTPFALAGDTCGARAVARGRAGRRAARVRVHLPARGAARGLAGRA